MVQGSLHVWLRGNTEWRIAACMRTALVDRMEKHTHFCWLYADSRHIQTQAQCIAR